MIDTDIFNQNSVLQNNRLLSFAAQTKVWRYKAVAMFRCRVTSREPSGISWGHRSLWVGSSIRGYQVNASTERTLWAKCRRLVWQSCLCCQTVLPTSQSAFCPRKVRKTWWPPRTEAQLCFRYSYTDCLKFPSMREVIYLYALQFLFVSKLVW